MENNSDRIRESFLGMMDGGRVGLSPYQIDKFLAEMPNLERPWYDRTPWSYLIGGAVALGVAALTKWIGWT